MRMQLSSARGDDVAERRSLLLSPEEQLLVCELREVPPSRLRNELVSLLDELLAFARDPRCPDSQADGVPCASARLACDECERVMTCLRLMRTLVGCA
jgi:hypothetical protein